MELCSPRSSHSLSPIRIEILIMSSATYQSARAWQGLSDNQIVNFIISLIEQKLHSLRIRPDWAIIPLQGIIEITDEIKKI